MFNSIQLYSTSSPGAVGLTDGSIIQSYHISDFDEISQRNGKAVDSMIEIALAASENPDQETKVGPPTFVKLIFSATESHNVSFSKVGISGIVYNYSFS